MKSFTGGILTWLINTGEIINRLAMIGVIVVGLAGIARGQGQGGREPLLLQTPALSKTQIVFVYGGEIGSVSRDGGEARRLVTGSGRLSDPVFSPDGSELAYAGDYDGNVDVYVVAARGGEPRRLTYHPEAEVPVGWSPDGKAILFRSHRASANDSNQLFTVPAKGGFPKRLPLSMGEYPDYKPKLPVVGTREVGKVETPVK